jgi:hypothetical protein
VREDILMCSGSEAGSYLRLADFCILNSRLESDKEEGKGSVGIAPDPEPWALNSRP